VNFIHSIKFRFTLWYLVILGIVLILLISGVYFYLSYTLHQNLDRELEVRATQIANFRDIVAIVAEGRFEEEIGEIIAFYYHDDKGLRHVSPRNIIIPIDDETVEQAVSGQSLFTTTETMEGTKMRVFAMPFSPNRPYFMLGDPIRPGEPLTRVKVNPEALVVGRPMGDIESALTGLLQTLLFAVPLTMLVAGGGGLFLARRAFKPVDEITQNALDIEETDLSRRITVRTRDELGRLANTLNQMIERLEKAFKRQQQFTGDASHELRAPLAVIQAESTLALQKKRSAGDYRKSLEVISQETKHMAKIIDQLLTLARADARKEHFSFEDVDLSALLAELKSDVAILCQDKGLNFILCNSENLVVKGDRMQLRQLFLNLVDNAIRYTQKGGTITVSSRCEGQLLIISVSDTGIGIPPAEVPHIFERFYRVDKARSRTEGSSGLGLAISRYIAEVHGGRIEVESEVGVGSTFSIWLPVR